MHEIFQLSVEHVMFEHVNHYALWRADICRNAETKSLSRGMTSHLKTPLSEDVKLVKSSILRDFAAKMIILKKRSMLEMETPEMKEALRADMSPKLEIRAKMVDEIKFSLWPVIFQKLASTATAFTVGHKSEHYHKSKMLKKLSKSKYYGDVKLITALGQPLKGTAAILKPSSLLFWPASKPEDMRTFDLLACAEKTDKAGMVETP